MDITERDFIINIRGKTTVINLLSCLTSPTFGECFIAGFDIKKNITAIQNLIGICPQDDIFYDGLTAFEHIEFFIQFRNVNISPLSLQEYVLEKLKEVELEANTHQKVVEFSGGMKRRLSVAISTIGNMSVLFLDEPTTGLDPLSKRKCWELIKKQRNSSVVILTTHSMEEAEALGDEILIMADGNLKAEGTSLFLKNHYGKGYQLSLTGNSQFDGSYTIDELKQWVLTYLPRSDIIAAKGGVLTVGIQKEAIKFISRFLMQIEQDEIFSWSVSNSSLEEVFLRLVSSAEKVSEGIAQKDVKKCLLCLQNPVDTVTLFTKNGIKVDVAGNICLPCSNGSQNENVTKDLKSFKEFKRIAPPQPEQSSNIADIDILPISNNIYPIMAISGKNIKLYWKERKTNICHLLMIIILTIFIAKVVFLISSRVSVPCAGRTSFYFANGISCNATLYRQTFICNAQNSDSCVTSDFKANFTTYLGIYLFDEPSLEAYISPNPSEPRNTIFFSGENGKALFPDYTLNASYDNTSPSLEDTFLYFRQVDNVAETVSNGQLILLQNQTTFSCYETRVQGYLNSIEDVLSKINQTYPLSGIEIELFDTNAKKLYANLYSYSPNSSKKYVPLYIDYERENATFKGDPINNYCIDIYPEFDDYKVSNILLNGLAVHFGKALGADFEISSAVQFMNKIIPPRLTKPNSDIDLIVSLILYFLLLLPLPRYIDLIGMEREKNLFEMMRIQGIGMIPYWIGNFFFFLFIWCFYLLGNFYFRCDLFHSRFQFRNADCDFNIKCWCCVFEYTSLWSIREQKYE